MSERQATAKLWIGLSVGGAQIDWKTNSKAIWVLTSEKYMARTFKTTNGWLGVGQVGELFNL